MALARVQLVGTVVKRECAESVERRIRINPSLKNVSANGFFTGIEFIMENIFRKGCLKTMLRSMIFRYGYYNYFR
jgi:hypothetical protein